ncbi:MAG: type III-A CRISPR-associated protein Csm2 [Phycisphaerae bacterium]
MNGKFSQSGGAFSRDRRDPAGRPSGAGGPVFDPARPRAELLDTLAEEQADRIPSGGRDELKSSQLRRFFGEAKDLLKRLDAGRNYKKEIEPMFKMMRSKASYAWRNGRDSKIPQEFHDFIENGVKKVTNEEQFRLFVQHFEAVVGFLYGKGKVGK